MSKQVIEYAGLPVGIAVHQDSDYRFIAVKFHVIDLDNRRFKSLSELRSAIREHVNQNAALAA